MDPFKNIKDKAVGGSARVGAENASPGDALRAAFAKYFPAGEAKPLVFGPLTITLPSSARAWVEEKRKHVDDVATAFDALRIAVLNPAAAATSGAEPGEHTVILADRAHRPPGVPADRGFDVELRNLSKPQSEPIKARAGADGTFQTLASALGDDWFSYTGISPSGERGASGNTKAKSPFAGPPGAESEWTPIHDAPKISVRGNAVELRAEPGSQVKVEVSGRPGSGAHHFDSFTAMADAEGRIAFSVKPHSDIIVTTLGPADTPFRPSMSAHAQVD